MNIKMQIKNKVMTLTFPRKPKENIVNRMRELRFTTKDNKAFHRAEFLTQNEYEYIVALLSTNGLGMPYIPAADKGFILDTHVPDSMGQEMHLAARKIKKAVGGSFIDYLCDKLKYTESDLLDSLACEQIDAVSMAIYNIERNNGIIIGDQTGIGKGRTAAAVIRYGIVQGKKPIFLSEKPNLFSDLYRDMVDIKSDHYKPFIVNARADKTHIKTKNGDIVYKAPTKAEQLNVISSMEMPDEYDYVCTTYDQFKLKSAVEKRAFLGAMAKDNVLVLDEAHNGAGTSQIGEYLQSVVRESQGVCYLSATFAKRADNMPFFALKTSIKEANLSSEGLTNAIVNGGVPLQEVLSAQLVAEGQMLRRERPFDGIEVNYKELKEKAADHKKKADTITDIVRDIIDFQENHIDPVIKSLDKQAAKEGKEIVGRNGTSKAGVANSPAFSKIFNMFKQILFSITADDVADHVINLHNSGKKPLIAFGSTMGSFVAELGELGDIVNADFSSVIMKALKGTMRYTVKGINGKPVKKEFHINEFSPETQSVYYKIARKIESISTGMYISPIDVVKMRLRDAGISVAEVTGRSVAVEYGDWDECTTKDELMPLTLADISSTVKKVMPFFQQQVLVGSIEHYDTLERLEREIKAVPRLGKGDGIKEYEKASQTQGGITYTDFVKPKLHYFYGASDWYITEWDGKDSFFGFVVLNGDMIDAEWGYISLSEIVGLEMVELDFHFDTDKPLAYHLKKHNRSLGKVATKKKTKVTTAQIIRRKRENVADVYNRFNNNEIDVLMINQSGSTGASAQAITTDDVTIDKVKQRVMVIWEAELDISTEIQKRGRVNRTGQVMLPIYDYIISSIPAQKRLLMMLKKKLKSLDANTTSNQDNSGSQLESEDFLNKYGDKVVYEYLYEKPHLAETLGDPLNFFNDKEHIIDGAASKVSGRVAILPIDEQERFYNEVMERYDVYIDLVKQSGEYDLEVETLDLKSKTLEKYVVIAGKGGKSAFGSDTMMEKCECNILKKPLNKTELDKELSKKQKTKEYWLDKLEKHSESRLTKEVETIEERFDKRLAEITKTKAFKKAKDQAEYIKVKQSEIESDRNEALKEATQQANNKRSEMKRILGFFEVGESYKFPSIGNSAEKVASVFLGYSINEKAKNPFAPSAVKLRFAVADSRRLMVLTCSGDAVTVINSVMSYSYNMYEDYVKDWAEHTQKYAKNRGVRYIMTGNLLQASFYKGKLVSYTTVSGKEQKGMLMPESWSPMSDDSSRIASHIVTPIANVSRHVMSIVVGNTIKTTDDIVIARVSLEEFSVTMPKKKTFIPLYTDADVIKLTTNKKDGFEMVSGMMRANVSEKKMPKFIKLMGERYSVSVEVPRAVYDEIFSGKKTNNNELDKITKQAMEMFDEDKAKFSDRLKAQKKKRKLKLEADARAASVDDQDAETLKLRARAIILKKKRARAKR